MNTTKSIPSILLILFFALVSLASQAQTVKWVTKIEPNNVRKISLVSKATLLGKETPVKIEFYGSNDKPSQQAWGAIGFNLTITDPDKLNGFNFTAFEGPDAPSGKMEVLVKSKNGTKTFILKPTGSYLDNSFTFGFANPVKDKNSDARRIFQSILNKSTSLAIIITDPKDTSKKLRVEYQTADLQKPLQNLLNSLN